MKRHGRGSLALGAALLLLAGCAGVKPGTRLGHPQERMPQASRNGLGPGGTQVDLIEKGSKQAKVRIEAYYPLTKDHKWAADLLLPFADKYPGQVYVRLADFRTERGKKLWYASGLTCGGIQINGRSEILLKGKKEPVSFLQKVDVFWTKAELEAAVRQAASATDVSPEGKKSPALLRPGQRKPSGKS